MKRFAWSWVGIALLSACSDATQPLQTAPPGVVFSYPVDGQLDVPLGTRIVVTFSDPVDASALGGCAGSGTAITGGVCLVGPSGVIDAQAMVAGDDGKSVQFVGAPLDPGVAYAVWIGPNVDPSAANLPAGKPLFTFTTRTATPKSAAPALVAVNGGPPAMPEKYRPMLESTTIRLLFSEPLDSRTVVAGAGAIELLDGTTPVPALIVSDGIHVSIDPKLDLTAGKSYTLKVGTNVKDLTGQPVTAATVTLKPQDSRGSNPPIGQTLRTRQAGDPGAKSPRSGAKPNVITIDKPLIGSSESTVGDAKLGTELGDPKALGGPIAFTIRKGGRLKASGLDVKLGGQIPSGLSTGDIQIELLTDGGGRLYRNPYQDPAQRPENDRAPLFADLSMDVAVYAVDKTGNAVLAQTVLGVQAIGIVQATDGVLDIETVGSMELGLLGVTHAPTNLVLELITDTAATPDPDTTAPTLISTLPSQNQADTNVDAGVELIFSEPIDLDRARNNGIQLQTAAGANVPAVIESHGSSVVVRPLARLAAGTGYKVVLSDVADVAGNRLAAANPLNFFTETVANTNNDPMTITAIHPGVACALTGATASSPGRCVSGQGGDDLYHPFTLPADEPVEVAFDQPVRPSSIALGAACNSGSVRIEETDTNGGCVAPVAGALVLHDRGFQFFPDKPWVAGKHYKVSMIAGGNSTCDANEVCGLYNAANTDVLNSLDGNGAAGGPDIVIPFTGAAATGATYMLATPAPFTDLNGSGQIDTGETAAPENRAQLHIIDTDGAVSAANFNGDDCAGNASQTDACIYIAGAMPVEMLPLQMNCALPGGGSAPACMPVAIGAEAMYGTSVSMSADTAIATLTNDTGITVLRLREPATGPVMAYIVDEGGKPTLVGALDLYMDAPDLSILLSSHDLHSKPITVNLKGPVTFLPDGRISIAAANTADVPVKIHVDTPLGGANVNTVIPSGEMKLQLLSRALRGGAQ